MMAKNVLGMIYSNSYDSSLNALTSMRTMGSVPFGGRYRLIDFALSNLVNCGVTKVGVIANSNFRSLMDHVGSGRSWDLSRKVDGLVMLPPFTGFSNDRGVNNRIDALSRNMEFITHAKQEYVLLIDSNFVCNMDLQKMFDFHTAKNADITIAYCEGKAPALENIMTFDIDENEAVKSVGLNVESDEAVKYSVNTILIRKALLERLLRDAASFNNTNFEKDIIQANKEHLSIFGYKVEGFSAMIDSIEKYFEVNMALLDKANRKDLFNADRPILTKIRNDMPVTYGIGSKTANSLIADGCIIEGVVKNSILSRGARVAKGAVVENSILMQDSYVGENTKLNCVIMDKNTVITPNKVLSGDKSYPFFVGKDTVI